MAAFSSSRFSRGTYAGSSAGTPEPTPVEPSYTAPPYTFAPYTGYDGALPPASDIQPASASARRRVHGPLNFGSPPAPASIRPRSADARRAAYGPMPVPGYLQLGPIRPASAFPRRLAIGPWTPSPVIDPDVPVVVVDGVPVAKRLTVLGYPEASDIEVQPLLNGVGVGSFTTTQPGPDPDEELAFDLGGRRQLTGFAGEVEDIQVDDGEEATQLVKVTVPALGSEWANVLVLPDFGAAIISKLGPPTQDVRRFDWTMNGLGSVGFGETEPRYVPSVSVDPRAAAMFNTHQLPDVWPDADARWMWVQNPALPQPQGHCHFRIPSPLGTPGKTQVWCAAYDYAEVYIDGVLMLTCDTPGVAQHVEIEATPNRNHLIAIKAYNDSGRAGVLFSMLPVLPNGLYGVPLRNSQSGWDSLAYPTRTFISTPGQVVKRLHNEATIRGAQGFGDGGPQWELNFTNLADTRGRPWPRTDPIELDVGMSYLDVLDRLAEDRIDYSFAPSGRRLNMWIKDSGSGLTRPAPWTEAVDMTMKVDKVTTR